MPELKFFAKRRPDGSLAIDSIESSCEAEVEARSDFVQWVTADDIKSIKFVGLDELFAESGRYWRMRYEEAGLEFPVS